GTVFSCVADDTSAVQFLSKTFSDAKQKLNVLLDVDCGQHRTGIEPGDAARRLYRLIATSTGLNPGGLHAYDGHIHEADLAKRTELCTMAFSPVNEFHRELLAAGLP